MKLSMLKPKTYLWLFLSCAIGLLITLIGVNFLVDPYRFFGTLTKQGFNEIKPKPSVLRDEVRLNLAIKRQPSVVVIGNSRVEAGFNPLGEQALLLKTPVQVLAIPGNTLAKTIPSLIELGNKAPIKTILVGLDFQDYVTARDIREQSLQVSTVDQIILPDLVRLKWLSLVTIDSVIDSFKTLRIQRQSFPETLAASGFNPSLDYIQHVSQIGHHGLFEHSMGSLKGKIERAKQGANFNKFLPTSPRLAEIALILEVARQKQWNLELFFYPAHAEALALYEAEGLGELISAWKNEISLKVETARRENKNLRLWDFSCLSEVTGEVIPGKGDHQTKMKFYWESGHFKESVGDLIMNRILKDQPTLELGSNPSPVVGADTSQRFDQCRELNKSIRRTLGSGANN
jgi:hypothetical protein